MKRMIRCFFLVPVFGLALSSGCDQGLTSSGSLDTTGGNDGTPSFTVSSDGATTSKTAKDQSSSTSPTKDLGPQDQELVLQPYCKRIVTNIDDIDAPIGSLRPRDVAQMASLSVKGAWVAPEIPSKAAKISLSPDPHGLEGQISLAYNGGAVRFVENRLIRCSQGVECTMSHPLCVDEIEVDMELVVQSSGRVFSETWTSTVAVPDTRDPDFDPLLHPTHQFIHKIAFDPETIEGEAKVTSIELKPDHWWVDHQMIFEMFVREGKFVDASLVSHLITVQVDNAKEFFDVIDLYDFEAAP